MANSSEVNLRQGLPGRRISGGSRSPDTACLASPDQPVIALMPESNLGLTLAEHPTFWFAIPSISQGKEIEFGLYNQNEELIYQKTFEAPSEAGIASLSLPETAAALNPEENYRWYLSVVCDPASRAEDLVVTGWVRRVEPDSNLLYELSSATPQEQLDLYRASGLWHETITTLASLHPYEATSDSTGHPTAHQWNALLESVALPQVMNTPFSRPIGLALTTPLTQAGM